MEKSPDAFRTISEVADWLGVPTHVLRFWESRFPQVKPVKRAGGRRYYRPADMMLLGGIKRLLHDDGMTIRGVQKMLREEGVRHVSSFSQPLDTMAPLRDVTPEEETVAPSPMAVDVEPEPLDNVVAMASAPPDLVDEDAMAELVDEDAASEPAAEAPAEPPGPLVLGAPTGEAAVLRPAAAEDDAPSGEAAAPEPVSGEEKLPEFSFLRRPRPEAPEAGAEESPQPDLFASRRASDTAPPEEPPRPRIPPTPGVPLHDPEDDDPSVPARPGAAARLLAGRLRPDHAAIARAVTDLRALRARL